MTIDNEIQEVKIKPVNELTFSDDFMFGAARVPVVRERNWKKQLKSYEGDTQYG